MNWAILCLAGLLEIVWAVGLKFSDNFSKLIPSVVTLVAMLASIWLLGVAMRTIPLGTAYAVWTGIGMIGAVLFGMFCFNEPVTFFRIFFISLIFIGVLGLKWISHD